MSTLFISDLHLCAERPAVISLFIDFLRRRAAAADALYILGDLFEYWIGDEALEQEAHRPIVEALAALTRNGTPVSVLPGNRDFLLGPRFERVTGCRLLEDPTLIDLYGTRVLIMHGDSLCTDDVEYQAFRRMVRSQAWREDYLAKSIAERERLSRHYRQMSKAASAVKRPEIMDVNPQQVELIMRHHDVCHLIHGHTHRPAQHSLRIDGQRARRTVLGDWYDQGSVLRCDTRRWVLQSLPLPAQARLAIGAR